MRRKQAGHGLEGVFVLLLFGVFAGCLLLVLLTGARSYKRVADRGAEAYEQRICTQYIATKVRHYDTFGGVAVSGFDLYTPELSTLFLHQNIEGTEYCIRIYYYDGAVRELFTEADQTVAPEDGQEILPAGDLRFTLEDRVLTIHAVDAGGTESRLVLRMRCGEEAA